MPNSIDTRVVEMQFDNAKFEKNVQQSIKSLNKLDKALELNDAASGFKKMEEAANSVDFSKMEKSLSFIEYRLSAFGMTSAKIINKVTDKIGNMFTSLPSKALNQIKSGGMSRALKLEHANFMLDGILKDAQKVKDVMDNAVSPAVDGTAYGLDAAANAASQFVASGIQDIDKLKTALTGISGVAAMSGAEYEEIAHIFTKVAASGRMMGDTVMELSTRGINATAVLADHLHKTADEIKDMQKKGQISFETFAEAMNNAYGDQAKKANDTFTGAMSNMKAALSRIGADFATPYLNNMREIFNALRLTFNDVRKALKPLVSMYEEAFAKAKDFTIALLSNEKFVSIYQNGITNLVSVIRVLSELLKPIGDGFKRAFPQGLLGIIAGVTERTRKFLDDLMFNRGSIRDFTDIMEALFNVLKTIFFVLGNLFKALSPVFQVINVILGVVVKLVAALARVVTSLTGVVMGTKKFKSVADGVKNVLYVIVGVIAILVNSIKNVIREVGQLPIVQTIFENISDAISHLADFVLPALEKALGIIVGLFMWFVNLANSGLIKGLFNSISEQVSKIFNVAKTGGGFFKSFLSIFTGGFKNVPKTVKAASGAIDALNDSVGNTAKSGGILDTLSKIKEAATNFGNNMWERVIGILDSLWKRIETFGMGRALITGTSVALIAFLGNTARLVGTFRKAVSGLPNLITSLSDSLKAPLFNMKAKAIIIGIAVAILSLAAAIFILTKTDSKKVMEVSNALLKLVIAMGVFASIISIFGKGSKDFEGIGIGFAAFAGAIGILAASLKILSTIDMDLKDMLKRVFVLGTLMGALSIVFMTMSHLSGPVKAVFGSALFLSFAYGIKMMVNCLKLMTELDMDKLEKSVDMLLNLIIRLSRLAVATTLLGPFSAIGFLGLVGGLLILIAGINLLADSMNPEAFKMVSDFIADIFDKVKIFLTLITIVAIIRSVGKTAKDIAKAVDTILHPISVFSNAATEAAKGLKRIGAAAVLASLALFLNSAYKFFKQIGELPDNVFEAASERMGLIGLGVILFLGILAAINNLSAVVGTDKPFLESLKGTAVSLSLLMLAIAATVKIADDIENPAKAIITLAGIMLCLSIFLTVCALLEGMGDGVKVATKSAIAISVLIAALSLSIGLLSMVAEGQGGWQGLIAAAGAMLIVVGAVALLCFAMSKVKAVQAFVVALSLAALFGVMAIAMRVLQNSDWENAAKNMLVILASVLAMELMVKALGDLDAKKLAKGLAGIVLITTCLSALMFMSVVVNNVDWIQFGSVMAIIVSSILVMNMIVQSLGGLDTSNIVKGLAGIVVITACLSALMYMATFITSTDWTQFGVVMLVIVGAVAIMGLLAFALGKMETGDLAKGLIGITVITACLAALMYCTTFVNGVDWKQFGAVMLIIVGAVFAMQLMVIALGALGGQAILGMVAMAGITACLAALMYCAQMTIGVDWKNFAGVMGTLVAAVALLSVIMVTLGALVAPALLGAVALAAVTAIMVALAFVAQMLNQVQPERFLQNCIIMLAAITVLGAVMLGAGAIVMTGGGAVAILAGAAALLVLAGVMAAFAGVGMMFGTAAQQIALGLTLMAPALTSMGDAIEYFSKKDFDGLLGNLAGLIGTIEALSLCGKDLENSAKGLTELANVTATLEGNATSLSTSISTIDENANRVKTAVSTLTDALINLGNSINTAIEKLSSDKLAEVVSKIAKYLEKYSPEYMVAVGETFFEDIVDGMKSDLSNAATGIIVDFIAGLNNGANDNAEATKLIGQNIAQNVIAGARGPKGFDSHSPAEEAVRMIKDLVLGFFKGNDETKADQKKVGSDIADNTKTGYSDSMNDGTLENTLLSKIGDLQTTANNNPITLTTVIQGAKEAGSNLLNGNGLSGLFEEKDDFQKHIDQRKADLEWMKKQRQQRMQQLELKKSTEALTKENNALSGGSGGGNTGKTKKNTKAKEENKKANDKKTKAINEESEALNEETQEVENNEEAIREQAEQIEVVTEKFDEALNFINMFNGYNGLPKMTRLLSNFWSKGLSTSGFKSVNSVSKSFKSLSKNLTKMPKNLKDVSFAFDSTGKYVGKVSSLIGKSDKTIKNYVDKTGKTLVKVVSDQAKVFEKAGNSVYSYKMRLTKNVKDMGKQIKAFKEFQGSLSTLNYGSVQGLDSAKQFIDILRGIQTYYVKVKDIPENVQAWMWGINNQVLELDSAYNALGRNIGKINGNYLNPQSQVAAYVQDAFISLAATLYDGSEAANEYATEHERLLFLMENGLATQEEVDEHFQSYIKRIMDTLKEYRDSIEENLRGSMNIFEKFNQNLMADGDDLLDNIESQIAGMTQWSDMLMELSKRSVDVNILKMLTDEGTSSFGKLKKMLSMTKEELALFNQRYKESEQAIRSARDTSLAALANATTFANQRAAAASKKLTKEQLAESARAAKRLISDARAVADNQARYRSFTKLEEKKYLATLTEEARKAYNKRLKDQKKYLKQEQKLAKKADTLRKQKKDIQDNVKSFDSLIKIYQKYQNSASAMVEINKQINESLKSVKDNIHDTNGYSADDMRWSWIKFAETLEDTGSGAENYFDELKARIETYVKSVRDAVNITQSLFEEFKTADKVSLDKMFGNAADNLSNMQDLADLTKKAGGMGLSADFWTYYKTKYIDSKDFAGAVAFLKEITSASKSEIDAMLGLIKKAQEASEAAAKALEDSQVSASGGAQLKVIQDAEDRLNRAKASLASTTASANKDITALNKEKTALENEMRNLERERVAAATIPNKNERAHVLQMLADAQQDALSKYNNITRLIAERQQSIAKATEEVNKSEKELSDALKKNAGSASATIQDATVKHFQSEYDKAVAAKNAAAKAAKDSQTNIDKAKKTKAEAEKALKNYKNKSKSFISPYKDEKAAKKALDDAKKIIDTETKKIKALTDAELAEAEAKRRLADAQTTANKTLTNEEAAAAREKNLQTWLKSIKSLDLLNAALKKVSKTSEEYGRIQKALKESLSGIKGAIDQYGSRWLNIANLSDTVSTNLDNISTAFLEFAESLGGSDDDSKSWFENMGQRLAEYRDSLDSTIRSQINLFDEFKKFSGNKGTTASKYLDNMSSQINGLEEWLTNLELLAKKGVSKDIIQMFASEGISSFEKVAAFVQASESEVGELNSRMKQYQDLVAEAADRAMATVGYSYTESAKNLQDKLMKEFEDSGVQRIKEAAEDGSKMLITGIKDGVTNAMPEIIGAVANTAKAVTNAIANEINTAPLMNAISSGLTSANATLNVANISGNAINGFYDTVTEEAITKFKMAVDSINEYINMNLQTEYTITVHVDTSEIDEAVARMNNAIGNTRIHANDASNAYVQSYQAPTPTAVFGAPAPSVTNNITYEQNNYSPKALSRTEIYRQTQNQLSTISDVVASASGG